MKERTRDQRREVVDQLRAMTHTELVAHCDALLGWDGVDRLTSLTPEQLELDAAA